MDTVTYTFATEHFYEAALITEMEKWAPCWRAKPENMCVSMRVERKYLQPAVPTHEIGRAYWSNPRDM